MATPPGAPTSAVNRPAAEDSPDGAGEPAARPSDPVAGPAPTEAVGAAAGGDTTAAAVDGGPGAAPEAVVGADTAAGEAGATTPDREGVDDGPVFEPAATAVEGGAVATVAGAATDVCPGGADGIVSGGDGTVDAGPEPPPDTVTSLQA